MILFRITLVLIIILNPILSFNQDLENKSFEEFFYSSFTYNRNIEQSIKLPLQVIKNNDTTYWNILNWLNYQPHTSKEFICILSEHPLKSKQISFYNIITPQQINTRTIYLNTNTINIYNFREINNNWILNDIKLKTVKNKELKTFLDFLNKFSSDFDFAKTRIQPETTLTTWDNNFDYPKERTSPLELKQLRNIEYLFKQINLKLDSEINQTLNIYIVGIFTGYNLEFQFTKENQMWFLSKLINKGM